MSSIAAALGRILLSILFLVGGVGKLMNPGSTETMLAGVGMPAGLAVPAGLFELVAGICIALGLMTRIASLLLAGFCLLTAVLFHNQVTDPIQAAMFLKNVAIAGGLLLVFAHSQVWYGRDRLLRERRHDIEARDAELRAARAEGRAEGAAHPVDGTVAPRRRWF